MKNNLYSLLAITLVLALALPVGVNAGDGVDEYIPKLEEMFGIGDEYDDMDSTMQDFRGKETFHISWSKGLDIISVEIDTDGNILSYGKHKSGEGQEHAKFPTISREEALENAEDMLRKIDPDLVEKTKLKDVDGITNLKNYIFHFIRNENGIYFNRDNVSVRVDNNSGEVDSININWNRDIELPSKENIIGKKEAFGLYEEGKGVELIYSLSEKNDRLVGNFLYGFEDKSIAIDAKTGEEVEVLDDVAYLMYYGLFRNLDDVGSEKTKELIENGTVVGKEQARKEMREFSDLDESYTIQSMKLQEDKLNERYVWNMSIYMRKGNSGYGTDVQLNAQTKEVLDFSTFNMNEGEDAAYSEEQALEKAQAFLEEKSPDKYKQVEYTGSRIQGFEENINEYAFSFERVLDGVKIPQNGFLITVNAVTGEILSYNYMWNDIEIPSRDNVMDQEKARKLLVDDGNLELKYVVDRQSLEGEEKEVKLVYGLDSEADLFVDAKTGEFIDLEDFLSFGNVDYSGKEYSDLDESYAGDMVKRLKDVGLYLPGEKFHPKKDISKKDFLYLLSNTRDYIAPYDEEYIYEDLMRRGVIESDEDLDETLTRGEAAKYVVRSFGQEKSANLGDIYKSNYEDIESISEELRGYVIVAEGLGMVSGQGNFRADDNLTREEAAVITYNILNR